MMAKHGLGRIERSDRRDAGFLLSAVPAMAAKRPKRLTWWLPEAERLDQGSKPYCVGFAWKHFLRSKPKVRGATVLPTAIYNGAQELDGIPGEDYDGTTVRGGVKWLQ